jgi:beta-lactam-binding protein with PASTA domain
MILRLFQFALLLVLLVVVAMVSALTTMHFAIHGAEVKVPDFRGMGEADARRKAAADGLEMSVDDHFYSAVVPESRIVTQSPAPGTIVRSGWQVRVGQSLGAQKVAVPSLVHDQERAAALAIRRASLQLGTIAHMPYALAEPGTVIAQSPDAGAASVDRPTVALLLSAPVPPEASGYVMPDLTNQPEKTAQAAVAKVGLKLAPPLYRQAEIPPVGPIAAPGEAPAPPALPLMPGTVIAQEPAAGTRVEAGGTIQFTLAQ